MIPPTGTITPPTIRILWKPPVARLLRAIANRIDPISTPNIIFTLDADYVADLVAEIAARN